MHDLLWMFGMVFSAIFAIILVIQIIKGYALTWATMLWLALAVIVQVVAWHELGINPLH